MEQEILENLEKILRQSIKKCLGSKKQVAIIFSGGLDSSLVAYLAHQTSIKVTAFTVGLENSNDIQFVNSIKKKLPFKTVIKVVSKKEIEKTLPKVNKLLIKAGVEPNLMQLSLATGLFLAAQEIKKAHLALALSGQGADKLFAGFWRYTQIPLNKINSECQKEFHKVAQIDRKRQSAIANNFRLTFKYPYLDPKFIKNALNVPPRLKIKKVHDQIIRKFILRELAKKVGLPKEIANRPKKSFQYSTGIQKEIIKLTRDKSKKITS